MKMRLTVLVAAMVLLAPGGASASCIKETAGQQQARAKLIVEGEILPQTASGKTRVRVLRYIKGAGPAELGLVGAGGDGVVSSIDINPQPGERWRLLGSLDANGDLVSTACDGSAPVAAAEFATQSGTVSAEAPHEAAAAAPNAATASSDENRGSTIWLLAILVVVAAGLLAGAFTWRRARRPIA